jgi:hypothetical protein
MSIRIIEHNDNTKDDNTKDTSKEKTNPVPSSKKTNARFPISLTGQPLQKRVKMNSSQVSQKAVASCSKDTSSVMVQISSDEDKEEDLNLEQEVVHHNVERHSMVVSTLNKGKAISDSEKALSIIVTAELKRNCSFVFQSISENPITINVILNEVSFIFLSLYSV